MKFAFTVGKIEVVITTEHLGEALEIIGKMFPHRRWYELPDGEASIRKFLPKS
jgi:hypothetical protein